MCQLKSSILKIAHLITYNRSVHFIVSLNILLLSFLIYIFYYYVKCITICGRFSEKITKMQNVNGHT